ncbi:MAG TPA: HAD family hydrolase [Mycobacteriales bacterium]|nr:HAD family hydrolase [Mycobacteriales bacterium]
MLKAVTYDCWNTLLVSHDDTEAIHLRIAALTDAVGIDEAQARVQLTEGWQRHHDAWLRHENYGAAHVVDWLLERHGRTDDEELRTTLRTSFEEASLETGASATPYAVETLESLRSAGVGIAVICDAGFSPGRVIRELFRRAGLFDLVEVWAFSDEVDACKPRAEMFAHALDGLGVTDPADAMHVGDLWRTDVVGARSYGMHAARYTGVFHDPPPHGAADADHVLDDHRATLAVALG